MYTRKTEDMVVGQLMLDLDKFPVVGFRTLFKEALEMMSDAGLGIVCVVDDDGALYGILTDGDIRRKLLKVQKPFSAMFIEDVVLHSVKSPVTIGPDSSIKSAVDLMGLKKVWDLPVVDDCNKLVGLLHLHPVVEMFLNNT